MKSRNLLLSVDSYKHCHFELTPTGLEYSTAYIESRGGVFDKTLFYGIHPLISEYFMRPITMDDINEAEPFILAHGLPFNREGWEYIVDVHGGYLPLKIKAIREGTVIETKNCLVQIVNTDPNGCAWLPAFFADVIMRGIWYPTTVATISKTFKDAIEHYLDITSDNVDSDYSFVDFSTRGCSSWESAAIAGAANLVNFRTTDNLPGMVLVANNYTDFDLKPCAVSVVAGEHSGVITWGREHESDYMQNVLDKFLLPGKIVSIVSDTYNIWNAIELFGTKFKEQIISSGGTVVIRPDSGSPSEIILKSIQLLESYFGTTVNSKGYRVLPSCIRLLQGDGVCRDQIVGVLATLEHFGYSAENVIFGAGGELGQNMTRDTLKFAAKVSAVKFKGSDDWIGVSKDPITDPGKKSKEGVLKVILTPDGYKTIDKNSNPDTRVDYLETVYYNGVQMNKDKFENVRKRALHNGRV